MARRSDIDWPAIRAAFEAGETNVTALSRRFKVARGPIIKHRDEDNWTVTERAKEQLHAQARCNVIDMATRQAIETLGGDEAVKATADAIAEELRAQRPLLIKAAKLIDRTFDRALRLGQTDEEGNQVPGQLILGLAQGETTAVSDLLGALAKFISGGRVTNAKENGVPSEDVGSDESIGTIVHEVVYLKDETA